MRCIGDWATVCSGQTISAVGEDGVNVAGRAVGKPTRDIVPGCGVCSTRGTVSSCSNSLGKKADISGDRCTESLPEPAFDKAGAERSATGAAVGPPAPGTSC